MNRTIHVDLTPESFKSLQKEILDIKKDIESGLADGVKALAESGKEAAIKNSGHFAHDINYSVTTKGSGPKVSAQIVGDGIDQVIEWEDGTKSETIDPLLMAEYGSGYNAIEGHGGELSAKYPYKVYGRFNPIGWRETKGGELSFSEGEVATRPMHNAMIDMEQNKERIIGEALK